MVQEYYRRLDEAKNELGKNVLGEDIEEIEYEDAYFIVQDILSEYSYGPRVIKRFQRHFADEWHDGDYREGAW